MNTRSTCIRVSNSLDPDQDRQNVGPDLGPNYLQRSSKDDKSLLVRLAKRELKWFLYSNLMMDLRVFLL